MGKRVLLLAIIAGLLGCASVSHAETEVRGATLTVTLSGGAMPNNTGGDEVWLWNTTSNTQIGPKVSYTGLQAKSGATVPVGGP